MRPPPYVGISAVTTPEQASALLCAWPTCAPPQSLMLGLLASQKTMMSGERNPRSADPAAFADIFSVDRPGGRIVFDDSDGAIHVSRTLNLIHYFTRDTSDLGEQLLHACAPAGEYCDGVQVNVPWPPVDQLEHFARYGDYGRVVLQVGPKALAFDFAAENITGTLAAYDGLITDVLLDPSGGRGVSIDPERARGMVAAIRETFPSLGITIAGGLCAETLPSVASMVRGYGLSVDAEGRLWDRMDELDMGKALAWLHAAAPLAAVTIGHEEPCAP